MHISALPLTLLLSTTAAQGWPAHHAGCSENVVALASGIHLNINGQWAEYHPQEVQYQGLANCRQIQRHLKDRRHRVSITSKPDRLPHRERRAALRYSSRHEHSPFQPTDGATR